MSEEGEPEVAGSEGGSSDVHSEQSQQDWSDVDADAALMAAEEQDLLGEAGPLPPPPAAARTAAEAAAGGGAGVGSGNGVAARQQQRQQQELLLVSLRLERQGMTDKQVSRR